MWSFALWKLIWQVAVRPRQGATLGSYRCGTRANANKLLADWVTHNPEWFSQQQPIRAGSLTNGSAARYTWFSSDEQLLTAPQNLITAVYNRIWLITVLLCLTGGCYSWKNKDLRLLCVSFRGSDETSSLLGVMLIIGVFNWRKQYFYCQCFTTV